MNTEFLFTSFEEIISNVRRKLNEELETSSAIMPEIALRNVERSVENGVDYTNMNNKQVDAVLHGLKTGKVRNRIFTLYLFERIGSIRFVFLIYDKSVGRHVPTIFNAMNVVNLTEIEITFDGEILTDIDKVTTTRVTFNYIDKTFCQYKWVNGHKKPIEVKCPIIGPNNKNNVDTIEKIIKYTSEYNNSADFCSNNM